MNMVEVCAICDIAECHHIREEKGDAGFLGTQSLTEFMKKSATGPKDGTRALVIIEAEYFYGQWWTPEHDEDNPHYPVTPVAVLRSK